MKDNYEKQDIKIIKLKTTFIAFLIAIFLVFVFLVSAESAEEIVQLFGNYHQLSEILKEKANTTGKILLQLNQPIFPLFTLPV